MRIIFTIVLLHCVLTSTFSQNKKSTLTIAKADSLVFAGDFKTAKDVYDKVMDENIKDAGAWSRYGLANLNLKNYLEAVRLLEKGLSQSPPTPVKVNTYARLARAYANTNNNSKALVCLDSAATLGYTNLSLV